MTLGRNVAYPAVISQYVGLAQHNLFENDKALIFELSFCMKCSRFSDEVHTLLVKSEVVNIIPWFCEGCNTAFPQVKGMLKSMQSMESKLNESDIKLSNLSKTIDEEVDRLSKVENTCRMSSGLSITNNTTNPNTDHQITVRECINEYKGIEKGKFNVIMHNLPQSDKESPDEHKQEDLDKLNDICTFVSTEATNITNAVRLGCRKDCQGMLQNLNPFISIQEEIPGCT